MVEEARELRSTPYEVREQRGSEAKNS